MKLDSRLLAETKPVRGRLIGAVALGAAAGALIVAEAWLLAHALDGAFLGGRSLGEIAPWLAGALGALALRALATGISGWLSGQAAERVKHRLRVRLFEHLLELGPAYGAGERTGELTLTLSEGVEALDAYIRQYLPRLALAALVPLAILLIVFPIDRLSGVVLLVTAPLIPVFMILIGQAAGAVSRQRWQTLSRLGAHFLDVVQGLPTLKLLGMSRAQAAGIRAASERFRDATLAVLRVAFLSAFALEMVGTISTALVAVEIGLRLLAGRLVYVDAMFVLILAPEFYRPMRNLGLSFHAATSGVSAAERIFEVLGQTSHPASSLMATATHIRGVGEGLRPSPTNGIADRMLPGPIQFDRVSVTYTSPDGTRRALTKVSFAIEPGQMVALVGASGAGKSTLAALLLRFLEPESGMITVGGTPLVDWSVYEWRAHLAWVPQRPHLFADSAADNIQLGMLDASHDAIQQAAQQAHADSFIRDLPQGYRTPLGEKGTRLSGGQAQRIALARAFLRNAPLVIFDEPTAHLDPALQARLDESIRRLMAGRTTLIIAHRMESVRRADQVIVLEAGHVVETGPPDALLAAQGPFARLAAAGGIA